MKTCNYELKKQTYLLQEEVWQLPKAIRSKTVKIRLEARHPSVLVLSLSLFGPNNTSYLYCALQTLIPNPTISNCVNCYADLIRN